MESHEYRTLFEYETTYWWYRGLHLILLDTLDALGIDSTARVLDAGCGTGQNLVNISDRISTDAYGFDLASEAIPLLTERGLERICRASVNDIPFSSDTFDAVVSIDVLECDAVDPDRAYEELYRVTRPGGHIILVVPAYDWLMSDEHHRAVRASRRFTRSRLRQLLQTRAMTVQRVTHLFATLLPAVAAYRLCLPLLTRRSGTIPESELRPLHPAVNELLFRIVDIERRFLAVANLPVGSSILAVVRKAP